MEKKDIIVICFGIIICAFILSAIQSFQFNRRLGQARTELDDITEQLYSATDANRKLTEQLDRERTIIKNARRDVNELSRISSEGANTVNDCIRIVRDIRNKVQELEDSILDRNSNSSGDGNTNYDTNNKIKGENGVD